MTLAPESPRRRLLPMLGRTHGSRSAVTCHLRCGDACAKPAPNTSGNDYFRDIASASLSRRSVLGAGGALALVFGAEALAGQPAAAKSRATGGLPFRPIAPVAADVDALTVPRGYTWSPVIRWGDPILPGGERFDVQNLTPEAAASSFGYNNDYLALLDVDGSKGREALLVANHEYTNEYLMFPVVADPLRDAHDHERQVRIAWASHGMSVVQLRRRSSSRPWEYDRKGERNRRVTATTPFDVDGPAAGSALLQTKDDPGGTRVLGTLNNCAGGRTPWGTVLSGEENFNQYFYAPQPSAREERYGLSEDSSRRWDLVDPRFSPRNTGYENEPNRFGWIVELDPFDPESTPVKHTALGRFKHEGATIQVAPDGRVVAYMGDDERFDYVYKFVSRERMATGGSDADRAHNRTLLSDGDLYVARFTGDGADDGTYDGTGEWLPLVVDGQSAVAGFSVEEVLVYTRLAADAVQPTRMDRPEDVQPHPETGYVYLVMTNNTRREEADEANPRPANKDGHVIELREDGDDAAATTFTWSILLLCGDPGAEDTYFAGFPKDKVSPIACPDNLAFDSEGSLWISTDGQPGALDLDDALHKVPLEGDQRGHVQQFLAVPAGAECTGPIILDREGMVLVAVQHPGEDGTYEEPQSYFPDYVSGSRVPRGEFRGPRPSVAQVHRD